MRWHFKKLEAAVSDLQRVAKVEKAQEHARNEIASSFVEHPSEDLMLFLDGPTGPERPLALAVAPKEIDTPVDVNSHVPVKGSPMSPGKRYGTMGEESAEEALRNIRIDCMVEQVLKVVFSSQRE